MTTKVNTCEGGTNGVAISAANSGGASGDAWDSVTGNGVWNYSTTHPSYGTKGAQLVLTADPNARLNWSMGGTDLRVRFSFYHTSNVPATMTLVRPLASGSQVAALRINSSNGRLILSSAANSTLATSTTVLNTSQQYGIEMKFLVGTGTTRMELLIYNDGSDFSATPDETISSHTSTTLAQWDAVEFPGLFSSNQTYSAFWMDSFGATDTGAYLGETGLVSTDATVTPSVISGTTALLAPTLSTGATTAPALISAAVAVPSPALVVQTVVSPSVITGSTAIPAPSISTGFDASVSPALVSATTSVPSPTLTTDSVVSPDTITALAAVAAPAVVVETVVSSDSISATTSVPAPTLYVETVATPAVVTAATVVPAPTLYVETNVSPTLLTATTAVPAPTMHTGSTVTPARVNAVVSIPTPLLTAANEDPQALGFYVDWEANGGFVDSPTNNLTTRLLRRSDINVRYGRDQARVLSPAAPGELGGVLIDNHSRDYSPENTGSPLFPNVKPARELRLAYAYPNGTSNVFTLFRGFIDDYKVNPGPSDRSVSLTGTDVLAKLTGTKVTTELYQSITTGDAIEVILDEIGWDPARRIIDTGSTVVRWWWLLDVDAFEAITQLVNSEGPPAIFHADADGNFIFRDRHHRAINTASNTSQATFTEGSSEPAFSEPFEYDHGWRDIINSVSVTVDEYDPTDEQEQVFLSETTYILTSGTQITLIINADAPFIIEDINTDLDIEFTGSGTLSPDLQGKEGSPRRDLVLAASSGDVTITRIEIKARPLRVTRSVTVTASDSQSIIDYGVRTYNLEIPWAPVEDAQVLADSVVAARKDKLPIIQILLKGKDTVFTAARIVQQLTRDIGDRITVSEPETVTNHEYWIEQIEHNLTHDHELLETKFGCERVFEVDDPSDVFILGSATNGVLGTNRLAH